LDVKVSPLHFALKGGIGGLWIGVSRGWSLTSLFVRSFDECAVFEVRSGSDEGDEVRGVDRTPSMLGGFDELERHRDPGGAGAGAIGDALPEPDGREAGLSSPSAKIELLNG
jgi:hypothetical protein